MQCDTGHLPSKLGFCRRCGLPTGSAAVLAPALAPTPAVVPGPAVAPALASCAKCAAPLGPDEQYCEQCGHRVHAAAGTWTAVATADRPHYETAGLGDVPFPRHYPARTFELTVDEVCIGRRGSRRSDQPEIDLSGQPQDTGISHRHAVLRRTPSGWTVTDLGSPNGTRLNDAPLTPNRPAALAARDRIYLGAWATIEVRPPAFGSFPDPGGSS